MKHIGIQTPCSENWNTMTSSEKGAFCQKCATHVRDFTNKTNGEIKQTLRELIGQPICARITETQQTTLNLEFEAWQNQSKQGLQRAFVFSLVVVFGLALFSCSNEQDKQQIQQLQATAVQALNQQQWGTTPALSEVSVEQKHDDLIQIPEIDVVPLYEMEEFEYVINHQARREPTTISAIDIARMPDSEGHTMGDFAYPARYLEYLEATETIQEYDELGRLIPTTFASVVFPNPATTETTFELSVPVTNQFEINLFDMNGKFIQSIHKGEIQRGTFQQQINLSDLNPGIYLVTIFSKDYKETVRISKI